MGVKTSFKTCRQLSCTEGCKMCHLMTSNEIKVARLIRFSPTGNRLSSKVHWRKLDLYCTRPEEEHAV